MKETKPNHQMLERLIYIHKRIKAGKYPNCTFLSKKLECSIPTINRDIEFLRDRFLAPIEYESAKKGIIILKNIICLLTVFRQKT